jgi:hypothetical protein
VGWVRAYVSVFLSALISVDLLKKHLSYIITHPHSMLKNVKGQSEEDNAKRMAILDEILAFFKEQARKTS